MLTSSRSLRECFEAWLKTQVTMALILSQTPMVIVCDCLFFQTNKHPLKDLLFVSIHSLI